MGTSYQISVHLASRFQDSSPLKPFGQMD
jgi:hypothetical protein